jgi:signal peptidase II
MSKIIRIILILVLVLSTVGCDQVAKLFAKSELAFSPPKTFFQGIVRLQYAENTGAFLSIGAHLPQTTRIFLILIMTVVVVSSFVGLFLRADRLDTYRLVAFSLILAGASGNLIDRHFNDGRVIDFVILAVGPFRTGIFNVADVLIIGGILLLSFVTLRQNRELKEEDILE